MLRYASIAMVEQQDTKNRDEYVYADDILNEASALYVKLGKKLDELSRMIK